MIKTRASEGEQVLDYYNAGFDAGVEEAVKVSKILLLEQIQYLSVYLVPGDVNAVAIQLLGIVSHLKRFQDALKS